MMKKNFYLLLILFLSFQTITAQDLPDKARIDRANEIISQARQAVYQKVKREDIKSLYLQTNGTTAMESVTQIEGDKEPRETKLRQTLESNTSVELADKAKQEVLSFDAAKNPAENHTKIESLVNGEKFSQTTDMIMDGKAIDMNAIFNAPFMPESLKKQMKEAMEKAKPTKEKIQKSISEQLYTVLLSPLWGDDKVFVYVGKAEAGAGARADILEIESDTGRQTRWFFDEKTHLLLMITDEISKGGISAKTTQYFSDYQPVDGLLIAKKINVETETSSEPREMEIMGKKMKMSGKSKMVSEMIVKDFKINPKFKPETFAVKETKDK
ncbi:MAG: hypothetical protein ACR2N3_14675 [Pyrinomonadaceae bacterium]